MDNEELLFYAGTRLKVITAVRQQCQLYVYFFSELRLGWNTNFNADSTMLRYICFYIRACSCSSCRRWCSTRSSCSSPKLYLSLRSIWGLCCHPSTACGLSPPTMRGLILGSHNCRAKLTSNFQKRNTGKRISAGDVLRTIVGFSYLFTKIFVFVFVTQLRCLPKVYGIFEQ